MAAGAGPERRGRRWRTPALVVIAGARREGVDIAERLLDALPRLRCPTIVSLRDGGDALHDRIDDGDTRLVTDGAGLGDARVWIAPGDRHTIVRDGRLFTERAGGITGDTPSLGALYHSVRVGFGSRVFAVVADAEQVGGTCLRLLRERGACVVRPPELASGPTDDHWSIPTIATHLRDLAADQPQAADQPPGPGDRATALDLQEFAS